MASSKVYLGGWFTFIHLALNMEHNHVGCHIQRCVYTLVGLYKWASSWIHARSYLESIVYSLRTHWILTYHCPGERKWCQSYNLLFLFLNMLKHDPLQKELLAFKSIPIFHYWKKQGSIHLVLFYCLHETFSIPALSFFLPRVYSWQWRQIHAQTQLCALCCFR